MLLTACLPGEGNERTNSDGLDLLGLKWSTTTAKISEVEDVVTMDGLLSGARRLRRYPVKVHKGAAISKSMVCADWDSKDADREEKGAIKVTSSSLLKKVGSVACEVLKIRSTALSQRVMSFNSRYGWSCDGQLDIGGTDDCGAAVVDMEAIACEWYVLSEACLALCACSVSKPTVDWRIFQPLQIVLEKTNSFADLEAILRKREERNILTEQSNERLHREDCSVLQKV